MLTLPMACMSASQEQGGSCTLTTQPRQFSDICLEWPVSEAAGWGHGLRPQVYTPERLQAPSAALDFRVVHPNGTQLAQRLHAQQEELTVTSHGPRVPGPHLLPPPSRLPSLAVPSPPAPPHAAHSCP